MLARKIIKNEALGLKQDKLEYTQYVVIMPMIIAMLFSFVVVRFIGLGMVEIKVVQPQPFN